MIYIGFKEDHIQVQDTARKFAADQLEPIALRWTTANARMSLRRNLPD